jgi:hypothetical protein
MGSYELPYGRLVRSTSHDDTDGMRTSRSKALGDLCEASTCRDLQQQRSALLLVMADCVSLPLGACT